MKTRNSCPLLEGVLDWYDKKRPASAPSFGQLWGLAWRLRRNYELEREMTDEELLGLAMEAIRYSNKNFDPSRGKRLDIPAEQRFSSFFCLKIRGLLANWIEMRIRWSRNDSATLKRFDAYEFNPEKLVVEDERDAIVREGVSKLKPAYRNVIHERYWGAKKFREIGDSMGIKEATARSINRKALISLKEKLNNVKDIPVKWT